MKTLARAYASRAQVVEDLRNKAVDEDVIVDAIHAASRWVDRYKGRDFVFHDHTTTAVVIPGPLKLTIGQALLLPKTPVITLTEVIEGEKTLVEGTDFVAAGGPEGTFKLVRIRGEWLDGVTVTLKGTFGFEVLPQPSRVDITGQTITATIDASPDIVASSATTGVTVTDATSGEFVVVFTPAALAALAVGEYPVSIKRNSTVIEAVTLAVSDTETDPKIERLADGSRKFTIPQGSGWAVTMIAATGPGVGDEVFAVPASVNRAVVMLAANLTGHQQKDVAGLDGQLQTILDRTVPKPVLDLLGAPYRPT